MRNSKEEFHDLNDDLREQGGKKGIMDSIKNTLNKNITFSRIVGKKTDDSEYDNSNLTEELLNKQKQLELREAELEQREKELQIKQREIKKKCEENYNNTKKLSSDYEEYNDKKRKLDARAKRKKSLMKNV